MNEEQLAGILANHLDALLEDEPRAVAPPHEIGQLLQVAQNLTDLAPTPRPTFGPALKDSLLAATAGDGQATGSVFGRQVMVPLIIVVIILTLLVGIITVRIIESVNSYLPSPTPLPAQTRTIPVQPPPSDTQPARPTTAAEPDPAATKDPIVPPKTSTLAPTLVLDKLPVITVTVGVIEDSPIRPDLVPGINNDDQRGDDDSPGGRSRNHDDDNDDD